MKTHTTQDPKQTRKAPAHNPIVISQNTEENVSEIIKLMKGEQGITITYTMPSYDHFKTLLYHFQTQIGQHPYELSMANKTIRLVNNSVLRFYRCDHTLETRMLGLRITKAYIDGHLSLNAEDYKSLMANIASRVR